MGCWCAVEIPAFSSFVTMFTRRNAIWGNVELSTGTLPFISIPTAQHVNFGADTRHKQGYKIRMTHIL